jgi:hypothetical protein
MLGGTLKTQFQEESQTGELFHRQTEKFSPDMYTVNDYTE